MHANDSDAGKQPETSFGAGLCSRKSGARVMLGQWAARIGMSIFVIVSGSMMISDRLVLNHRMILLLRQATEQKVVLCDYPQSRVGAIWQQAQDLRDYYDVVEGNRDPDLSILYDGKLASDSYQSLGSFSEASMGKLGLFFAGLATGCSDKSSKERLEWAHLALRLSRGSQQRIDVLQRMGPFYVREQMWEIARSLYEELTASQSAEGKDLYTLGLVYIELGRHVDARAVLSKSMGLPGISLTGNLLWLGVSCYRLGDYQQAMTLLEQAAAEAHLAERPFPQLFLVYHYQGATHERLGDTTAAIRAYERAVALMPDDDASLLRLTALCLKLGDFALAEAYVDRVSATTMQSGAALCLALAVKEGRGKTRAAEEIRRVLGSVQMTCP